MSVAPAGAKPDNPSSGAARLLADAAVQTLCRVALDGFDAAQHGDLSWLRAPAVRALWQNAVLRAPLARFVAALQRALEAAPPCGAEPGPTVSGATPDSAQTPSSSAGLARPDASADAPVPAPAPMPGERLRRLGATCKDAERGGVTDDGASRQAIAALEAAYGALCDAFGLAREQPVPRPRLSDFVAALAFDVDALSTLAGPTPEQREFASFRELMQLYEWT